MAMKLSLDVRNARLDQIETTIGASAVLKMRSGAAPAAITDADSGTVIGTFALPADWMLAASNGVKAKSGTWEELAADAAGTVGHYRVYASDGTTQKIQGTVTATGGGGDMEINNTVVALAQTITVTAYSWTEGNG
jgi:hypothetical protein